MCLDLFCCSFSASFCRYSFYPLLTWYVCTLYKLNFLWRKSLAGNKKDTSSRPCHYILHFVFFTRVSQKCKEKFLEFENYRFVFSVSLGRTTKWRKFKISNVLVIWTFEFRHCFVLRILIFGFILRWNPILQIVFLDFSVECSFADAEVVVITGTLRSYLSKDLSPPLSSPVTVNSWSLTKSQRAKKTRWDNSQLAQLLSSVNAVNIPFSVFVRYLMT